MVEDLRLFCLLYIDTGADSGAATSADTEVNGSAYDVTPRKAAIETAHSLRSNHSYMVSIPASATGIIDQESSALCCAQN